MQPLRLVGGTGSPARVFALVDHHLMRVAELVGRAVAELGAGHAFGVVGSGNLAVTNALVAAGVPYDAARHEAGAATMADAYARTSGRVGVVSLHQGCGLTNATTGISEAAKSRTPVLVLAADVAGQDVGSNFRIDQDGLVRSVGAVAERIHSASSAVVDVERAYRTAVHGRRTVVLNLPLDIQGADTSDPGRLDPLPPGRRSTADPDLAEALADVIRHAERPVFLAGRGALSHGPALAALADQVGALLVTSAVAAGTFADEAYDLGICGGFATPLATELVAGADVVLAWGCSLTRWTTRHGRMLGPDARTGSGRRRSRRARCSTPGPARRARRRRSDGGDDRRAARPDRPTSRLPHRGGG